MKVMILCGGRGTRLYEETEFRPKPLVKVGDQAIIVHIMEIFAAYGHKAFTLCLGYKGDMIKTFFLNFATLTTDFTVDLKKGGVRLLKPQEHDWTVDLVNTGINSGTGGRIRRAVPHMGNKTFLATYGDGLADVDINALIAHHRKMGRIATVTGVRETSRFGVIESDSEGLVSRFREKPVLDGLISGGFFVFEPEVVDYLDEGALESVPLETLVAENQLAVYRHDGYFRCMDTYRDYLELNAMYDEGTIPWKGLPGAST